ncbi:MAG TPA: hypothetical protein VFD64_10440 [Gemmatimonadaceae bacterium]|nr:hypothetical protein [Gemmatimonadaceae bacterium]
MDHQLGTRTGALRLVFGLTATLAGLDKFFNLLADWSTYVSPLAASFLPVSPETFMYVVGAVECAVGIAILGAAPVLGAYVASAWLLLVAVNLLAGGYVDVAVRDVVMAVAAFTLARLLELRAHSTTRAPVREASGRTVTAF